MARREEDSYTNGSVFEVSSVEEGRKDDKSAAYAIDEQLPPPEEAGDHDALCGMQSSISFIQQLIAEFLATFFLIFAGCGAGTVNAKNGMATFPGVAVVWGMTVMAMVYAVGHVSGAHINPAVTVGFAISGRFPWRKVPAYMAVQTVAATMASLLLRLMFGGRNEPPPVTAPAGSAVQSLVMEFIITFYLMFVIMAVATDDRAVGQMAGLAVGGTIMLNALFAGPVSGASMNPARSIGPALVGSKYKALWVYIFGPFAGAAAGAWAYNLIRHTDKTIGEIVKMPAGPTDDPPRR
ncbi:hypothetical protein U9M48_027369 [Paspalum notatum var. saurae]|uniref:Uncharacterized protein n=1 Tax=Paspalum notatum var. saurae TaxID=547442 RepID=A0AAQ3TX52_PASNO